MSPRSPWPGHVVALALLTIAAGPRVLAQSPGVGLVASNQRELSGDPTSGPQAPRFTEQPHDVATTAFVDAQFTVAYVGLPQPEVAWQFSADGANWNDVPGATTSVLVVRSPVVAHDGTKWRARLKAPGGSPVYSNAATLTVTKAKASIRFDGLMRAYDGQPKPVTITTVPAGLAVTIEYRHKGAIVDVPVDAGDYEVSVEVTGANYAASATTTMIVRDERTDTQDM
jgi:hypothetical protein